MQFDPKQAVAGALTLGLVFMLGNMVLHDPFSPFVQSDSTSEENDMNVLKLVEKPEVTEWTTTKFPIHKENQKLWGMSGPVLEPCQVKHNKSKVEQSGGYVTIKLSGGPHYHRSQVADAIVVAWVLGATFLMPAGESNSDFNDLYDIHSFIKSLKGVVKVARQLPELQGDSQTPVVVKVPYRVTTDYIEANIRPVFEGREVIRLVGFFPSPSLKREQEVDKEAEAIRCMVMHRALRFHARVERLGEKLLRRAKESNKPPLGGGGRIIAVDLRLDWLERKGCQQRSSAKTNKCFDAAQVGSFLQEVGFPSDTAIYLTQPMWDERLDSLKKKFPNIYTKEQGKAINGDGGDLISEKTWEAIDFYVCSHSDVFVPAISGMFYSAVAGERIAAGKTQILVPVSKEDKSKPLKLSSVISSYVREKDHPVYSCLCKAPGGTST